jgi:hypothetical protein
MRLGVFTQPRFPRQRLGGMIAESRSANTDRMETV